MIIRSFTRFLKWMALIFLVWVMLDLILLGFLRREIVENPVKTNRTEYAAISAREDIIILGNSMARSGLNANRMADSLRLSVINLGVNGAPPRYSAVMMRHILTRHQPKAFIWVMNPLNTMPDDESVHFRAIKPLYGLAGDSLDAEIRRGYPHQKLLFFSNAILLRGVFSKLVYDRITSARRDPDNGYDPYPDYMSGPGSLVNIDYKPFTPHLRSIIEQSVALADSCGVMLFIIFPPSYARQSGSNELASYLQDLDSCSQALTFFNHSAEETFLSSPCRFRDHSHLVKSGAEEFTDIVIRQLMPILSPQPGATTGTDLKNEADD